jgi:BirA family transcriptional regulator, biotin operon repressor / biotin---[acetyl-CoA-carboxylase] ligase
MSIYLHHLEEAASTNETARLMAQAGSPHGTVVHATRQTAGRGRLGRSWWSPPEGAVLMSVILRPTVALARVAGLSLEVALAVVEVLARRGFEARIRWPNDVLIGGLKVAGVLSELIEDDAGRPALVVGLGLNANVARGDFPEEIRGIATSLSESLGASIDVPALLGDLASAILGRFERFERLGLDTDAIGRLSVTIGARVEDESGRTGEALGIAGSGALLVLWDGAQAPAEVIAGDIIRLGSN